MTASDIRFVEIYEAYFRRVYGYCRRRTSPDRVDDVVAETFLAAWRRINDVPVGDEALPWLYQVAYRTLGNHWRGLSRRRNLDDKLSSIGVTPVSAVEDYIVRGHEFRQVLEASSALKSTDQEILKLAVWEELPHAHIAVALEISAGAVKQRLYEARKNLTHEYNRLENQRTKPPAVQKGGRR